MADALKDDKPRYSAQLLRQVKQDAFNRGLEKAAEWHDAEAGRTRQTRKIAIHQICAAAIRSMKIVEAAP